MARQGRAGPALATAALGSFFAGSVATLLLAIAAPPLARMALKFGSAEYFSLIVLGLVASVALAHGSIIKALGMIVLGLLLGTVGQDLYSGQPRFTFGFFELYSGINFVSVAVGVFGVAEILRNLEDEKTRTLLVKKVENLWLTKDDIRRIVNPILRGTALGSLLGVLPGGGHVLAAFASYSLEKKISRNEGRVRPRRDRGGGGARIRQQCRGPDIVHPAAHLRHSGASGDGADDRRLHHSRHHAGPERDDRRARAVLGADRLDVDRQLFSWCCSTCR